MAFEILSPGQVLEPAPAPVQDEPWRENLNLHVMCPECKIEPANIVDEYSSGDTVCGDCGIVIGDRIIDTRSEWRTFANDESGSDDPSRVGSAANPLLNGSQLETSISFIDGSQRSRELNRAHVKVNYDKSTKTLREIYGRIGQLASPLSLPENVIQAAQQLFKAVDDAKVFKGKNTEALIAGLLLVACRQMEYPRSFRDIAYATKVSKKEIGRTFKSLNEFFGRQKVRPELSGAARPATAIANDFQKKSASNPVDYCERYCSTLALPRSVIKASLALAEKLPSVGALAGRSPLSAAGACIYMASHLLNDPRTPKEIANVAGVSDGTVRTAYKYLYNKKDELLDEAWLREVKGDVSRLPVA